MMPFIAACHCLSLPISTYPFLSPSVSLSLQLIIFITALFPQLQFLEADEKALIAAAAHALSGALFIREKR